MRDKQGIPLLQMFAQCALHGATLEAAAKLYHMGCRHPPGQPVGGLGGVLFLSHPARPGRCHPAEYLLGLRPASSHAAPTPAGGAAHSGTCSGSRFPHPVPASAEPVVDAGARDDIPLPEEPPEEVFPQEPCWEELPPEPPEAMDAPPIPNTPADVFAQTEALRQAAMKKAMANRPPMPVKKKGQLKPVGGDDFGASPSAPSLFP